MAPPARRVLEVFAPPDGGVADHVLRLSDGIREHDWEPEVAAPAGSEFVPRLRALGLTVHELPFVRRPGFHDVTVARALRELDRPGRFSVVHAHSSKAGGVVRAALREPRRLIYTPHCFSFSAGFSSAGRSAYRLAERALLRRTGAIVAACDWERREALTELSAPPERVHVVYYGIPEPPEAQPDPRIVAFARGRPVAGMISVLRPQKDPLTLVRAAGLLRDAGRLPFCVAIVGNGELDGAVEAEIARLALGDDVRLFSFAGEVHTALAALDVFALPSLWESLPISIIEAMSHGLPVVGTQVNGVPEAVLDGVTGRVVAPGSPGPLGEAIAGLLADPDALREAGRRGRAHFEERFRLDPMLESIAALYGEAAR